MSRRARGAIHHTRERQADPEQESWTGTWGDDHDVEGRQFHLGISGRRVMHTQHTTSVNHGTKPVDPYPADDAPHNEEEDGR